MAGRDVGPGRAGDKRWENGVDPVQIEVNAVAQFLFGFETFLEFRITNVSPGPLTLGRFEVRLGSRALAPGVFNPPDGTTLVPDGQRDVLADCRVEGTGDESGNRLLTIHLDFSDEAGQHAIERQYLIYVDEPGAERICLCDPAEPDFQEYAGDDLPEGGRVEAVTFGEQDASAPELAYIRRQKGRGLRFVPLGTVSQAAPPDEAVGGALDTEATPECCAICRPGTNMPKPDHVKPERAAAYCPYYSRMRAMDRRYNRCLGKDAPIHLYIEINKAPFYMETVGVPTEFRLYCVHERPVQLTDLEVSLGGTRFSFDPRRGFEKGESVPPSDVPLRIDWRVRPPEGCELGVNDLVISLSYRADGRLFHLDGSHPVDVIPLKGEGMTQTNIVDIGNKIKAEKGAIVDGGPIVFDSLEFNREAFQNVGRVRQILTECVERRPSFEPVFLKFRPVVPPPKWGPVHRTRLHFEHNGFEHNCCILSTFREDTAAYGPVRFGRKTALVDVRLKEVEKENAEEMRRVRDHVETESACSRVGSQQWEIGLVERADPDGTLRLTNVNRSERAHDTTVNKTVPLAKGKSCALAPGARVHLIGGDFSGDIIGLRYAAHAEPFDELDQARRAIRGLLDTMETPPTKLPLWNGPYGGYRLARLFSLTGKLLRDVPGADKFKAIEAYVLVPGWATIGSSTDACIVVPRAGVAGLHAHLLHVDGYWFIMPHGEGTPVHVGDDLVPAGVPWPLRPAGTQIRLGPAKVTFKPFKQMYA